MKMPARCPLCGGALSATRLRCLDCGTAFEGDFEVSPLLRLSDEQMRFVETFLRCEGKLNRVQEVLGISYPTARSRLLDVIKALGYEVEEPSPGPEERKAILDELARGRITVDEAIKRLKGR